MSVLLAFAAAALFATGTFLLLQRRLSRILIGLGLIGHGANLLLLTSGGAGGIAPSSAPGDPQRLRRPAAAGACADVDRDHVRRHRVPARPRPPELADDPRRRGRGRRRGPLVARRGSTIDCDVLEERGRRARPAAAEEDRSRERADPAADHRAAARRRAVVVIAARLRWAQRIIVLAALTSNLVVSVVLLVRVHDDGIGVTQAGGWPAPLGISLVVDRLSAIMLVVSSIDVAGGLRVRHRPGPGGVAITRRSIPSTWCSPRGCRRRFITGDLFNLFVAFEMMLTASYVLITLGGRPGQVRSGMSYVVISLIASTLFVAALALDLRGDRHGQHGRPRGAHARAPRTGPRRLRRCC